MNPKITEWNGLCVWLVGASTGIGAALAYELSRRGARLALSARSADALQALRIDRALLLPCDVTDTANLSEAHRRLMGEWQRIDLTFAAAGQSALVGDGKGYADKEVY